jgi:galactitol-specific phosphotransferase system IIC component
MDQQPIPNARQPWQFSLGSQLTAVVFVAIACAAWRYFALSIEPPNLPVKSVLPLSSLYAIPISLCGAIGALRGHLWRWLFYGIVIDIVLPLLLVAIGPRAP